MVDRFSPLDLTIGDTLRAPGRTTGPGWACAPPSRSAMMCEPAACGPTATDLEELPVMSPETTAIGILCTALILAVGLSPQLITIARGLWRACRRP
jgi:hypothetical protein